MLFSLDSFIFLAGNISGLEGEILKPERTEHSEVNSKLPNPKAREDGLLERGGGERKVAGNHK